MNPNYSERSLRSLFTWTTADQFLKYALIGTVAVASDIILLYFFTQFLHIWYVISAGASYLVGVILVFLLNKLWSFQTYLHTLEQLKRFTILALANYIAVMALIFFLTDRIHIPYLVSKLVIIVIQMIWNFLLYKYWVFANS